LLKIRLSRVGKKKQPSYRVVVADARAARDGRYVEILGHYNPRTEPTTFEINAEKVTDWLTKGAQPTDRVEKLLAGRGLVPSRDWGAPSAAAAVRRAAGKREPRAAAATPPPAAAAVTPPPAPAAPVAVAEPEAPAQETEEPVATAPEAEAEAVADAEPEKEIAAGATPESEAAEKES
jgi:small subunit ribosomal protein S16